MRRVRDARVADIIYSHDFIAKNKNFDFPYIPLDQHRYMIWCVGPEVLTGLDYEMANSDKAA